MNYDNIEILIFYLICVVFFLGFFNFFVVFLIVFYCEIFDDLNI